ncbi:DUF2971 domain-containing protein [Epilithonimonas hungarica]|uniref:DUF2971 domain-containing protein n=1 Tax=Epilithonimonas hungarica TaxID=454006 RepID=A0A1G7LSM0_9FLAO|nr:DUF2971 domain-containing protein [Epilithonimonas hungarica]SDF52433.1 Protein of unknown function [Epilithonimonas hungarica]
MEEYIYHYTSIETLALILTNKNIRFNSLKNVDDINETEFSDENMNLSSHILISCWTDNDNENLAFWNMYTPNMQGVRIKLPKIIFATYDFNTTNNIGIMKNNYVSNSLVPESECFNKNYWILPLKDYFFPVEYTDDENLLKPKLFNDDINKRMYNAGNIGKYKSKIWEFQNEVRFKILIMPTSDINKNQLHPLNDVFKVLEKNIQNTIESYYISILEESFERMEITLGPKCNLAQELIVKSLIEKYNPKAKIFKNRFSGLIR